MCDDVTKATDQELAEGLAVVARKQKELSKTAELLQAEIDSRWMQVMREKYAQLRKEGGAASITSHDGLKVKASSSKKVEWDQEQLRKLASSMGSVEFDYYFKFSMSVPEKVYASCAPDMKEKFDQARTVKWDVPKITLEVRE